MTLLVMILTCCLPAAAAPQRAFNAFADDKGNVHISHDGKDHLSLGLAAWGPNWAWTGIDGRVTGEGAASVGKLRARIGRTAVRIGFHAESPKPDRLQLNYQVESDKGVGLTYIIVAVEPGAAFQGRQVKVQSRDRETEVGCPFGRRELGTEVAAMRLTDARGQTTVLRFDPPCEIDADGVARVVLAKDKLSGGEVRRLTISVELPAETDWYPTAAAVPDDTGPGRLVSVAGDGRERRERDRHARLERWPRRASTGGSCASTKS